MSVEILSVCQIVRSMIRGIILISRHITHIMCVENITIDILYKCTAHVLGNFPNFQCALGHNRSRRIKNSAFAKQSRKNRNKPGNCVNYVQTTRKFMISQECRIVRCFGKTAKSVYYVNHICLHVRPHAVTRLPQDGYSSNLIF